MIDHLNDAALGALPDDGPRGDAEPDALPRALARRQGSGWDAYLRYSVLTIKLIKAQGGTIIWTGDARDGGAGDPDRHRWDYVALVRYPSRARSSP